MNCPLPITPSVLGEGGGGKEGGKSLGSERDAVQGEVTAVAGQKSSFGEDDSLSGPGV